MPAWDVPAPGLRRRSRLSWLTAPARGAAAPSAPVEFANITGADLELLGSLPWPQQQWQWAPPLNVTYDRDGVNVTLLGSLTPAPGYDWWSYYYSQDDVAVSVVLAGANVYGPR